MTKPSDPNQAVIEGYFFNLATAALERASAAIQMAKSYRLLKRQVLEGLDLGAQFPQARKLGPEQTISVIDEAIEAFETDERRAWQLLPDHLTQKGRWQVLRKTHPFEHMARVQATYHFVGSQAALNVQVTTAGERIDVRILPTRQREAASQTMAELAKSITFARLSSSVAL